MFCVKCGFQMPDDANFCPRCGAAAVNPSPNAETSANTPAPQETPIPEPEDNAPPVYAPPAYTPPTYQTPNFDPSRYSYPGYAPAPPAKPEFPMKWFKFTIYVQLFVYALGNLIGALLYFTGASYGSSADLVYAAFPGMQALDLLIGLVCILQAVFAIFCRMQLAGFKRNGPTFLYILLASNLCRELFYTVASTVATRQSLVTISVVSTVLGSVILLVCDVIYFGKRKELFQD